MSVLVAESIGKRFGERRVLIAASLRAPEGRITALLGRNGCGKSTLLSIIAGHQRADHGHIRFAGVQHHQPKPDVLARAGLYYAPADNALSLWIPLGPQLAAACTFGGQRDGMRAVVARFKLDTLLDRKPRWFSTGERRRAAIALGFARGPACLLIDEPLNGIEPRDREMILAAMRQLADRGTAVVITGHEAPDLLGAADRIAWLNAGSIRMIGSPAAATADHAFRREYLGF